MKTFWRIFYYARPVAKYAVPYSISVILHAIFNTLTFTLIIPVLTTLFDGDSMKVAITEMPNFPAAADGFTDYFKDIIKFLIYKQFGADYSIKDVLIFLSGAVVCAVLLSNLFRFASQKIMENLRIHTLQSLRDELFKNIMKLNVRFFSNERKGDILSKLTSDINIVQYCVTNTLQVAFKEPALIIGYFAMLIAISPKLTLFVLIMLPITALIIGYIVKNLRKSAKEAQSSLGEMTSVAEEALSGIKVIKSYNIADYIVGRFVELDNRYSSIMRSMATRQQMASPMSEFLGVSAISIILIYGGNMVVGGELDPSSFLTYLAMFSQVTRPARAVADSFSTIHQGLAAGERVIELIDTKPTILDCDSPTEFEGLKEQIEFKNVSFSYDEDREILSDISFTIKRGETVAIVGSSGGGKSTIANLIPRFYDVNSGEILIDSKDIKEYRLGSIRDRLSFVSQDIVLFNDSIKKNIQLGDMSATDSQIEEAAKIANAHDFIVASGSGYETNIGDSGVKLSGGQRQRLSIARAVLRNPEILILDEATSALDTESEKLVQNALEKLLKGRTSLIIAHRLSTIQHADKIIVVDEGRIVETGAHAELIAQDGVYNKLIQLQQL